MEPTCANMNGAQPEPLRVAFTPVYPNPYQHLLGDALSAEQVDVTMQATLPSIRWLHENAGAFTWLHLHWLSGLYMSRYRTPATLVRFWRWLDVAQQLGYRLAWTAHNVLPHRPGLDRLHARVRQRILREADLVIAHCEQGRDALQATFGIDRTIHVVPIGSYAGTFPLEVTRDSARQRLQIGRDRFVYLSLGNIASYKGLAIYARLFLETAAPTDLALIAGRNRDAALTHDLEQLARSDSRLRVDAGFIPDDELQLYLRAADVVVAPFERILTSASVMTAMAAGLPVIVPNLGCLPELVTGDSGLVYEAGPGGLRDSLREIKHRDLEGMRLAAANRAASFSWAAIARQTAALYRSHLPSRAASEESRV